MQFYLPDLGDKIPTNKIMAIVLFIAVILFISAMIRNFIVRLFRSDVVSAIVTRTYQTSYNEHKYIGTDKDGALEIRIKSSTLMYADYEYYYKRVKYMSTHNLVKKTTNISDVVEVYIDKKHPTIVVTSVGSTFLGIILTLPFLAVAVYLFLR